MSSEIYRERVSLFPISFQASNAASDNWQEIEPGFTYDDTAASSWLKKTITIPAVWAGERVGLLIEITGGEPLLLIDGKPYQALDYNHADVLLHEYAQGNETHTLTVEIYARTIGTAITVQQAELVLIDRVAQKQYYDALAAEQLAGLTNTEKSIATCVGHSHVDLAYLWALPNTRKKIGRTWASMLRLMDEYADFRFTQSQPFLYQVAKEDYPELWERVKARVAEGRWEITGAMWVEPDANIPSGESLIRQVLHGQQFFEREFGARSTVAWLPDTFGFPATFPNILAGCGIHSLLTSKLSWNDTNRFPYDTFRWRGTDGTSEVLTHFLTTPSYHANLKKSLTTYNGEATYEHIAGAWSGYAQANVNDEILHCVGYGDGGGGTTRQMVEMVHRFADAPGMPQSRFGRADEFFDRLATKQSAFPTWRGELYLENHRGTYTSQAWIKQANRRCEALLRNAEIFSVLAEVEAEVPYPADELHAAWETLLTNQFHDILAGTVIPQAIIDAKRDLAEVEASATQLLDNALNAVAERVPVREDSIIIFNPTDTLRPAEVVRVTVPGNIVKAMEFADESDAPVPSQFLSVGKKGDREYLVLLSEIGALGYQIITAYKSSGPQEESTVSAEKENGGAILENDFARVTIDAQGEIVSFIHKVYSDDENPDALTEREVIAPGERGNVLALYEDKPAAYDGWNIDADAFQKRTLLRDIASMERIAVTENGPVRAAIEITYKFNASRITQRMYLYAHSTRLEFETVADWHEQQKLLCVLSPVAVNAERATYEIQHGYIERSTHTNTSWDTARFEVCHHRWMDLSEGDYGVSLLNDCKYGGAVRDNVLRLTLIKSGIYPDPNADQGEHRFTYALLPHTGDFRSETVDEAHALNYPLLSRFVRKADKRKTPALPRTYDLATVNDQGIVIDTIKKAEDGDGYIVRLYEAFNTRGTATLTVGFDTEEVASVNLMEEEPASVMVTGGGDIAFTYTPHEIKTFRIRAIEE